MEKKKSITKKDIILISIVSLIVLGILIFSLATRKAGDTAFIKYSDNELFRVDLKTGKYEAKTTTYVEETKPLIDGNNLLIGTTIDNRIEKGSGVIIYVEEKVTHFYILAFRGYLHIEYSKDRKQIRVVEEDSPYNICSNLGFSNSKPIICLPNLVSIVFDNDVDIII